jgi:acetolactate synthase-1/2/3 large subunit
MILSEYLHQQLAATGTARAFGVPGYFVMPIWQAFAAGDPSIVLARHESGAAFMADGQSRVTGRLGVILATTGPGMTNCVTGVACAYRDSVPMLVITGQAPTATFGRGAFLESYILDRSTSPAALFAPITKKSIEIVDAAHAAFLIDTAISLALSGRPGPVHLSVPVDLQQADIPVDGGTVLGFRPGTNEPTMNVERAADLLAGASRPLLLAGWGCMRSGARAELAELALEISAVVVASTKAVSCLPAAHPMRLGHLGPGQRSDIAQAIRQYAPDVLGAVGASLSSYYSQPVADVLNAAALIRIDVDADNVHLRRRAEVTIVGDARPTVAALREAVRGRRERPIRTHDAAAFVAAFQARAQQAILTQPTQFQSFPSMSGAMARLSSMLPDSCVVVPDAGNHWLDTIALHSAQQAGGLQLNCGIGAMGWAIGASVGIAMAHPDRLTVCVTGDGSMLMSGAELSVAAEHHLNLVTIVFNNRSHGRVRLGQRMDFDGEPFGTDIPPIDFAAWMAAMGLRTFKVERPDQVEPVLKEALSTPGTIGVEIMCHPDEVPASLRDWIEDGR